MKFLSRLTLILSLLGCTALCAQEVVVAQASQATGTGTIAGRVTIGDKPAQGIAVLLLPAERYGPERKPVARATTDAEGQFRLMNLAAGRYEVAPVAPAFVSAANLMHERNQGKSVNLAEGETVDKLDFSLVRGGVITGRVTDADARPVIGQNVRLATAATQGNERRTGGGSMFSFSSPMFQTDDRGIYRIYGIPPGTYVVSVGEDSRSGIARIGIGRGGIYTRTFHPNATDESKATIIEVTEGGEATNVDITLNRRVTTYSVSGRVIDAETGKPLANIRTGYRSLRPNEPQVGAIGLGSRTDAEGNFRFEGLMPGRYAAFTANGERSEDYSAPVSFEINEGDVTGLTIKVRRGASISGVAVIEGAGDRAALARLSQVRIYYWPESNDKLAAPIFGQGERVNPDGSFRISGLPPGKFRLMLGGWPPPKGFSLLRVERDGVEQRAGIIDVPAGGQVTGVRFVLEYGTAILRGQVRVENGTLPEGAQLYVSARRPTAAEPTLPGAEVDARGRFVMEGLPAGQYELRLGSNGLGGGRIPPVVQNVVVTNGVETQVTLVIDMAAKDETNK
jgi:protocatechuate 3,4-dioxygenase beta subunit